MNTISLESLLITEEEWVATEGLGSMVKKVRDLGGKREWKSIMHWLEEYVNSISGGGRVLMRFFHVFTGFVQRKDVSEKEFEQLKGYLNSIIGKALDMLEEYPTVEKIPENKIRIEKMIAGRAVTSKLFEWDKKLEDVADITKTISQACNAFHSEKNPEGAQRRLQILRNGFWKAEIELTNCVTRGLQYTSWQKEQL